MRGCHSPKPLQSPVEDGFTVDDFIVDEQVGAVSCPAGHTRPISRTRVARFGALCARCPLREQCTKSKTGRKIVLHQRDSLLRAARHDWAADSELRERYRKYRPNVERVVSQIPAQTWTECPPRPPAEAVAASNCAPAAPSRITRG